MVFVVIALVMLVLLLVYRLRARIQKEVTTAAVVGDQQSGEQVYEVINEPGETDASYDCINDGNDRKTFELQQNVAYATTSH